MLQYLQTARTALHPEFVPPPRTQPASLPTVERAYVNYSQITAEAAHRSHPAPQAILCCLDGGGGKGEKREKNEANCQILQPSNTDTSANKINTAWQSTKAAEMAHAYVREYTRGRESTSKGKPKAEECCCDLKEAWILPEHNIDTRGMSHHRYSGAK